LLSSLFFYSYVAMVLGRIIVSESKYDHLLFTFFMFVSPAERCNFEKFSGSWRKSETFDDEREILTEDPYFG
jgi:hypothetical protein